jgi:hypothetical protein
MSRTMLRKLIPAVAILSLVAGPAAAQVALSPFKHQERKLTPEEIEKQKAADAAYKAAMDKIPEKKANDPWGGIREPTPAASSSTATPPTKTAKTKQPPQ